MIPRKSNHHSKKAPMRHQLAHHYLHKSHKTQAPTDTIIGAFAQVASTIKLIKGILERLPDIFIQKDNLDIDAESAITPTQYTSLTPFNTWILYKSVALLKEPVYTPLREDIVDMVEMLAEIVDSNGCSCRTLRQLIVDIVPLFHGTCFPC